MLLKINRDFNPKIGLKKVFDKIDELVKIVNTLVEPPAAYKKYVALLTQVGVGNPTSIVLENTLGSTPSDLPTITRSDVGKYNITWTGKFTADKTTVFLGLVDDNSSRGAATDPTSNSVNLITVFTNNGGLYVDDALTSTAIEITVYS